jgi:hypothetical protein
VCATAILILNLAIIYAGAMAAFWVPASLPEPQVRFTCAGHTIPRASGPAASRDAGGRPTDRTCG